MMGSNTGPSHFLIIALSQLIAGWHELRRGTYYQVAAQDRDPSRQAPSQPRHPVALRRNRQGEV